MTGLTTTVSGLIVDPAGTPTVGSTAFVQTADGYAFLVKAVGQTIYNNDTPPLGFMIVSENTAANPPTVMLQLPSISGVSGNTNTDTFPTEQLNSQLQANFFANGTPGIVTPPVVVTGASGVRIVNTGVGGSNGRDGVLFVPPTAGGNGQPAASVTYVNSTNISTMNQIGIEAGTVGGKGGTGGSSYLSFWNGRDGGNAAPGATVNVTNDVGVQVATTGILEDGIFAYSLSGVAGAGGSGFVAPGGGTGGHSSDGGMVTVTNNGKVITTGIGSYGVYGLSVSNNGGNGGSQWGLVGQSGSGGVGGNGGPVSITNDFSGTIQTSGDFAFGILAQSVGGSGGSSGISGNLILSLQGSPDNGGNGGAVSVTNNGLISTTGDFSLGIVAQSAGGGGGTGGGSYGLVALGGSGSNGGNAGTVTVTNSRSGSIITTGILSYGILAQSVGGSGGSGSNAGGLLSVGGSGSKPGNGASVRVENDGTISTQNFGAQGIVAQSIGGGGGDGGNSGGMVSVGGTGSGGGNGDVVTVTNVGAITTGGNDARGILAQSVGGGGGNGGSSGSVGVSWGVAVGGAAGGGGTGGNVNLSMGGQDANAAAVVTTQGDRSTGVFAQSIGGGGGTGGGAVQVTGGVGAVSISVGGSGGAGGNSGTVTLSQGPGVSPGVSVIQTGGSDAAGLYLQSVGGGGGSGGYSVSVAASGGPGAGSLSVGVGGSGNVGGAGGTVSVGNFGSSGPSVTPGFLNFSNLGFNGSITTTGDRSAGFVAESIGGGGGNGGVAVSTAVSGALFGAGSVAVGVGGFGNGGGQGGSVTVGLQANIATSGASSTGLLAQSVGGGGGNGGGTVAVGIAGAGVGSGDINLGVGGNAGTGSAGGAVTLATRSGTIATKGENSAGIIVQSVGGGGGDGGYAVSAGLAGAGVGSGSVNVGLGGTGGGGGNGGTVSADLQSNVTTSSVLIPQSTDPATGAVIPAHFAVNSPGIVVQSVGGGGGNGGFDVTTGGGGAGVGSGAVAVGLGGSGASGGTGGTVNASSTGTISTGGDLSPGFVAQSIGGGGGNGGYNISAALAGAGVGAGAISVGLGGTAGSGNDAGNVTAFTSGGVTTGGLGSSGILAQSVGGGGGSGGFNVNASLSGAGVGSGAISVGLGGSGGAAGAGGNVALTVQNDVSTAGANSAAVTAQSVGGGGGNGGFNVSAGLSGAGVGSGSIGVSLGGNGAGGGNGGIVNASVTGNISTALTGSIGILAQSVGGGGGDGGFNVSAALSGAGTGSGAISVGLGGKGGAGGNGGSDSLGPNDFAVMLQTAGKVTTQGDSSIGIEAQSVGGGGGNGGFDISGALSGGGVGSGAISVGLGGAGGNGGSGKNVHALLHSDVTTSSSVLVPALTLPILGVVIPAHYGEDSTGILVQSVGGGGGSGGFNVTVGGSGAGTGSGAISVGLGGSGGTGGLGGDVVSSSTGTITTGGDGSSGFVTQSIGGGGGTGGFNVTLAGSGAGTGSGAISVGLGGSGGSGNNAGSVSAVSSGDVSIHGDQSLGILAQSIGGGGGNGTFSVNASGSGAGTGSGAIGFSLGGSGGSAGNAGTVGLTVSNKVFTQGDQSSAVVAQSIGGGGGNGGFSVGAGVSPQGRGGAIGITVGGFGGGGGSGSVVDVSSSNNIVTTGNYSNAILAQSVGGGGGNGAFGVAGTVSVPAGNALTLSASFGGHGGSAGDAGEVNVTSDGMISTSGNQANGVVAQSLGGGGGNGGLSVAGTFNFASMNNIPSISASLGGFGGSGGAGRGVTVGRTGATTTMGDGSVGILAQSIGGGGGNGGLSVAGSIGGTDAKQISASVGGFGGPGSGAGDVTVKNTGAITTGSITMRQEQLALLGTVLVTVPVVAGLGSDGILAQSIGGGGGNGGFAFSGSVGPTGENTSVNVGLTVGGFGGSGGIAGAVKVTNTGMITTYGANANGVEAQSIGGGGGNGGSAVTGQIAAGNPQSGGKAINVAVSVGGFGGSGNVAGSVTVDQTGGISTAGPGSNGILAQSIGGGGGTGGGANSLSLQLATSCTFTIPFGLYDIKGCSAPKTPSVNVQVDVGGFGGKGNNGGQVTVINHSFITTRGDSSSGIVAQSIGGGGGNGGQAIVGLTGLFPHANFVDLATSLVTLPISTTGSVKGIGTKFTVGGFGGAAGNGAAVNLTNDGVIQTSGVSAYGIEAQSIGGGGGSGGNASSGVTGALSVGGFGAASGNGGDVTVTNTAGANIATASQSADAIFAQSIGGGGGDGGTAGGLVAVGGFGGASGGGGTVNVENDAALQTSGDNAIGILAQSIGGGGGNGGGTGLSGIALGGFAGALGSIGDGSAVTVNNTATATILTTGAGADGIEAQSIGGGGGNGGGSTLAAAVTVGGHGGSSGAGGHVQIFNDGMIETQGADAIGVFGQSIGGSGGSGGGSLVSAVSVGGFGGSSGAGGEVDITNTSLVLTLGAGSDAIRGQSIGGGGGNAGGVGQSTLNGGLGLGLLVSVGGSGGGGGNGGVVEIANSGMLTTTGDKADGIFAQSVGGGGGEGGRAIGAIAVGGGGGNTGDGGAVIVDNNVNGLIRTKGIMSNGILAQSVGGGGGNGGGAYSGSPVGVSTSVGGNASGGGNGGPVTVDNSGQIQTDGSNSQAIFAQSVGGGGGIGAIAGSFNFNIAPGLPGAAVSVGGSGGGGGNGGAVIVENHDAGSIFTNGINSTAIFAQSVGGGGGHGGFAIAVSGAPAGSATVAVGGSGGAAGDGGHVVVTNNGAITINGKNSIGILAQSVGGGGGTAGSAIGAAVIPVFIGGQGGATGQGGDVTVTNTGSITIAGDNSIGIFAQSVGGGGGLVLPGGGATSITLNSGGRGNGGTVTTTNTGSIVVTGNNSVAFYAQSVGGGGGAVGADAPGQIGAFLFLGSAGGQGAARATIISQTGNLIASGVNSIALVAQSDAPGGNGDITVNILNASPNTPSLIQGGSAQGAGVFILGGANNQLNNAGIITSVLGIDGFAIRATTGNNHVDNTGMVVGSVDLGSGANSFLNEQNAVFLPGVTVNLGVGNTLTNEGHLSPGGLQRIITTNLNGNFVQTATGVYDVGLDLRGVTADRIDVTGTAAVSGTVAVNLIDPAKAAAQAKPGTYDSVIVSAAGGATAQHITLQAPQTAVLKFSIVEPNANDIVLRHAIDFAPVGLTRNMTAIGNAINAIQTAQTSPAFAPLAVTLFFQPNADALGKAYDSLSGAATSGTQQVSFVANDQFLSALASQTGIWLGNKVNDRSGSTATGIPTSRTWRAWMTGYGSSFSLPGNAVVGSVATSDSGGGFAVGVDHQISPRILVGIAGGGGPYDFNAPLLETSGTTAGGHLALYSAVRNDVFYTTSTLAFSFFDNHTKRHAAGPGPMISVPGLLPTVLPGADLTGHFRSRSISGSFETGYKLQFGNLEVTPFAGLEFGSLRSNRYTETGSSLMGLMYAGRTVVSLPTFLGLQFESRVKVGKHMKLSGRIRGAWKHELEPDRSIEGSFIAAPGFNFVVQGAQLPSEVLRSSVGASLMFHEKLEVFAKFDGDFSRFAPVHAGSAGIRYTF